MADLNDLRNRLTRRAETAISRASPRLESNLKRTSPVGETQNLRDETTVRPRGLIAEVVIGVDYASFVRDGTQAHTIVPRNASVLRFQWPAGPVSLRSRDGFFYFPKVRHPGTRPNSWYDQAIEGWTGLVESELR